jgi:hypothetical protein
MNFIVANVDNEYWIMTLSNNDNAGDTWYSKYAVGCNRLNAQQICAALNRGHV